MNNTIHEPFCIRRYKTFGDGKIHVCQYLNHFEEKPLLVHAIHLHHHPIQFITIII